MIVLVRKWLFRARSKRSIQERASGMTVNAIRRRGFEWARVGI